MLSVDAACAYLIICSFSAALPLLASHQKLLLKRTTVGKRMLSTTTLTLFEAFLSMIVLPAAEVLHQSLAGVTPFGMILPSLPKILRKKPFWAYSVCARCLPRVNVDVSPSYIFHKGMRKVGGKTMQRGNIAFIPHIKTRKESVV